jgi:MerR family copper efflux transcriptional regulator
MALAALDAGGRPRRIGAMNIGKVSKLTGLSARMIRHYEAQGILHSPRRRDSGHRDYGAEEIRTLRFIRNARDLGFRIADIGRLIELSRLGPCGSSAIEALVAERLRELRRQEDEIQANRRRLERLLDSPPAAMAGHALVGLLAGEPAPVQAG